MRRIYILLIVTFNIYAVPSNPVSHKHGIRTHAQPLPGSGMDFHVQAKL